MDSFIGQIIQIATTYAPQGFMLCEGQTLPVQKYQALFSLLTTRFGGNGTTNFALPDMRTEKDRWDPTKPVYAICINGNWPARD